MIGRRRLWGQLLPVLLCWALSAAEASGLGGRRHGWTLTSHLARRPAPSQALGRDAEAIVTGASQGNGMERFQSWVAAAASEAGEGMRQAGPGQHRKLTLKQSLLGLGAGVLALTVGTVARNPGLRRQGFFWVRAFPVYMQYRLTGLIMDTQGVPPEQANVVWDKLHARHVDEMLNMVRRLKGYFIKICQLASARVDLLPLIWVERFSTLQDAVPPKPGHEIIAIVEKSYGKKIDEVFEEFDAENPLGAASIGQCHMAKLKGSGKLVAVKVMYPEAESVFWSDMRTLRHFATIAQPAYVAMLDEVQRQFSKEFDYMREARDQEAVRKELLRAGFGRAVVVPEAYLEHCTREVLVMEYIPGKKLLASVVQEGPTAAAAGGGASWFRPWDWAAFGAIRQRYTKRYAHWLVDSVVRVHGHQILRMGLFNGDPHPGNILLTPDGRLGLIDYGQIKVLGRRQRRTLARLIIALADGDEDEVVRLFVRMGFRSKRMDRDTISKVATIYFDRDDASLTKGVRLQVFFERLQAQDPFTAAPEDYIMAARVALFMRGLGTFLDHPISIAKAWRPLAVECLQEKGDGENDDEDD